MELTRRPDDLATGDDQGALGNADMAAQPSGLELHATDQAHKHGPSSAGEPEAGEIEADPSDNRNETGRAPSSAPTATAPSAAQAEQEVLESRKGRTPIVWVAQPKEKK